MGFTEQLSLTIQHEYFSPVFAPGLTMRPGKECSSLLKRFGLLSKTSTSELKIFIPRLLGVPALAAKPWANEVFDFLVFTNDEQFSQYTALGNKKNDEIYLFTNQTLNIEDADELVKGVISAEAFGGNANPSLLGVIRLQLNYKTPAKLTLSFSAKSIKWKYYVLAGASRANLVVDGNLSGVQFSRKENIKRSPDAVVKALTANYPVAKVSFFESDNAIALNSNGRKNIQLKDELKNTVIIKHLPNPTLHNNGIQIINLLD